jgi:hypothetical protein
MIENERIMDMKMTQILLGQGMDDKVVRYVSVVADKQLKFLGRDVAATKGPSGGGDDVIEAIRPLTRESIFRELIYNSLINPIKVKYAYIFP